MGKPTRLLLATVNVVLALGLALAIPLAPAAFAADYTITVTTSLSQPSLTVPPGSRVIWQNQDGERHRFRSVSGPTGFDTGNIEAGQSGSVTLNTEGTYSYVDERDASNSAYHGTIVVSSSAPSPTTTTTVAGGGGGGGGPVEVRMAGRRFAPASVTIAAGGSVLFINDDGRDHTATGSGNTFDTGLLAPGQRSTRTFNTAGTYPYICLLHPDMTGTVTVTGSGGTAPPPAPTTTTTTVPPVVGSSDVSVFDFGYSPASKTVPVGSTVRFVNTGIALHTVTDRAGRFDSGLITSGAAFTRRFDVAGTYDIFCTLHPEMTARLSVTDSSGTAPAPPPPTTTTTLPPGSAPRGNVQMRDFSFAPASVSVRAGSSLTFVNTGAAPHTVTAADRSFDSGLVQPGGVYTRRFSQPGVVQYVCTLHPAMIGTITVLDAAGNAPPTTTSSTVAGAAAGQDAGTSVAVEIIDLDYEPRTVTVAAGTEVLWTNTGVAPHTVTARDGSFTSELLQTGGQYRRVFDQAGSFEYFCTLHTDMVGTVIVEGAVANAQGGETVEVAAPGAGGEPVAAASSDPASPGMGWIVVGLVAAMVFGGGTLVMVMLRRSLLTS